MLLGAKAPNYDTYGKTDKIWFDYFTYDVLV